MRKKTLSISSIKFFLHIFFTIYILYLSFISFSCSTLARDILLVQNHQPANTGLYASGGENYRFASDLQHDGILTHEYITTPEGLKLHALNITNPKKSDIIILSIHGWSKGAYTQLFKYGKLFYKNSSVNIFLPEMRNCGKSEGTVFGWGYLDYEDMLLWINRVIEIYGSDCKIVLHGLSAGATAALFTTAQKLPSNVVCAISDAVVPSFTDLILYHVAPYQGKKAEKCEQFAQSIQASFYEIEGSYDFSAVNLYDHIEKVNIPVLFIYSAADPVVPINQQRTLFEQKQGEKDEWLIEDSYHDRIVIDYPTEYLEHVINFINKYLPSPISISD